MNKIFVLLLCSYFHITSAQTLNPLAAALFNNVKTRLTVAQKNDIAKTTGLSLTAEKTYELDGMPVSGAWIYPADLNNDGVEEIFLVLSSSALYGNTGQGFTVFLKNASGSYAPLVNETGVPCILNTTVMGFRELLIGGPGFEPVPVLRWNGKTYVYHRTADAETMPFQSVEDYSASYVKTIQE